MKEIINTIYCGDMAVKYIIDTETNVIGLSIIPKSLEYLFILEGNWKVESLIQLKIIGDRYPDGFSHGHTMRNSVSSRELCYKNQEIANDGNRMICTTTLQKEKLIARHYLIYEEDREYLTCFCEIENIGDVEIGIEMLSSFSLNGFSMLSEKPDMTELYVYRLRSKWSGEGKLETNSMVSLQLEPSWMRSGVQSERFGQIGSMPVRKYFPWLIVEDSKNKYSVGVQLYHPSSWQMEIYNRDDKISVSGGIADREFGHWYKFLESNEKFKTPKAVLTTTYNNSIDEISNRLVSAQLKGLVNKPKIEQNLPIVFNEFCTSWGAPSEEVILKSIDKLRNRGITYFVIDAGWYAKKIGDWTNIGDWEVNKELFPSGLAYVVNKIKEAGMIPGIWFELELVGKSSDSFEKEEMLLKRDGYSIQTGCRRFLDMRKPEVIKYLDEKVIDFIKKYEFGYLKIDYNDNIGIGCEGADSLGEGLRESIQASQRFFEKISDEIPNLVIENCSSGGHRLEPSMQNLFSMSSFSDAHECKEIPIIAANVIRAVLPQQSQIWAVLRKTDDKKRMYYTMTAGFLGRLCLSGDIFDLSDEQWNVVDDGIKFYKSNVNTIKSYCNYRYGEFVNYYNKPTGWQAVLRKNMETDEAILIVHFFENILKLDEVKIVLDDEWVIIDKYARNEIEFVARDKSVVVRNFEDFDGLVLKLRLKN